MADTLERQRLTFADLETVLAEVGIAANEVSAMRLWVTRRGDRTSDAVLEVETLARDSKGSHYFAEQSFTSGPTEATPIASEIRRFFLSGDLHLSAE